MYYGFFRLEYSVLALFLLHLCVKKDAPQSLAQLGTKSPRAARQCARTKSLLPVTILSCGHIPLAHSMPQSPPCRVASWASEEPVPLASGRVASGRPGRGGRGMSLVCWLFAGIKA